MAIPYQFEKVFSEGNHVAYENTNVLPFFRTTNLVFVEDDFANASTIAKGKSNDNGTLF